MPCGIAAARIRVELVQRGGHLCIDVRDWGRGFDLHAPSEGYGLKGIRYRARALQGEADISSSPGNGTQINVRVPSTAAAGEGAMAGAL